jgi:hypothetical protein
MNEQAKKREVATLVAALAEAFGREASPATHLGYWLGLQDLPIEAIRLAVSSALRRCKFMPSPAELREMAGEGDSKSRAQAAWLELEETVRVVGGYRSVDFEDRTINAAVRSLGGWERICLLSAEEFDKWLRKDFLACYEALDRSGVSEEASAPLVGICDRENLLHAATAEALGFEAAAMAYREAVKIPQRTQKPRQAIEDRIEVPRITLKRP